MAEQSLLYGIIKDILGHPRKINSNKQQYSFDCPTCSSEKGEYDGDGKGNLELNLSEGVYNCWACGETHGTKGSLKKFFKTFATKTQIKKLKMIGFDLSEFKSKVKEVNVIEDLTLPKGFIPFTEGNPKSLVYKQAKNYITKERKITDDIIEKYGIGYVSGGFYDSRIVIPSYDTNNELNYWVSRTYINAKPKYLNPDSDKEQIIFNEKFINWDSDIYLVEGPFDHIVVHNSIPMLGKKLSNKLKERLFHDSTANIVLLLDDDAWENTKKLYFDLNVGKLYGRIRVIKMEDGYDIAKIHEKRGRQGVVDIMKSGYQLKESGL
jgi:DNA primase